ncbi:MAG: hypothetical protein J1F02_09990 [Lachnospiraceae bacterium]|nr:hypothetical protein [Lachnospiraceae bacterium]
MAVNLKGKKTSLTDEASIYAKRSEHLSEKEKLKNMSGKQKRDYFATYYLPKILIIALVLLVAGYILWSDFIHKKDIYFRCAVLNEALSDSSLTEFGDQFTESLGKDTSKESASFYCYFTDTSAAAEVGASVAKDQTEITSRLAAGVLDGMIASPEDSQNYLANGIYVDLQTFLTREEYRLLEDNLYFYSADENTEQRAYGVSLKGSPVWQALFDGQVPLVEQPVFFIVTNSDESAKEYARTLIHYFFPDVLGESSV